MFWFRALTLAFPIVVQRQFWGTAACATAALVRIGGEILRLEDFIRGVWEGLDLHAGRTWGERGTWL